MKKAVSILEKDFVSEEKNETPDFKRNSRNDKVVCQFEVPLSQHREKKKLSKEKFKRNPPITK